MPPLLNALPYSQPIFSGIYTISFLVFKDDSNYY